MPINAKGKELLKEPLCKAFRDVFKHEIIKMIDEEGKYGSEFKSVVEKTLKKERFLKLVNQLLQEILEKTNTDEKDLYKTLSILVEEDVADEIKKDLGGQIEEKNRDGKTNKVYSQGEKELLWTNSPLRYIGKKTSIFNDIIKVIKNHKLIQFTLILGIALLSISSLLFNSLYKALIVGFTLTVFSADSLTIKIANITGALGGVLLFSLQFPLYFNTSLLRKHEKTSYKVPPKNVLVINKA